MSYHAVKSHIAEALLLTAHEYDWIFKRDLRLKRQETHQMTTLLIRLEFIQPTNPSLQPDPMSIYYLYPI